MNKKLVELKKSLGRMISNFSVTSEDGKEIIFDGDKLYKGLEVNTYDDNGNVIPLNDGEYVVTGIKIIVSNGKISEIEGEDENEGKKEELKADIKDDSNIKDNPIDSAKSNNEDEVLNLKEQIKKLESENKELKEEIEELKKPMDKPLAQETLMNNNIIKSVPTNVKGTKFERAFKIFNN